MRPRPPTHVPFASGSCPNPTSERSSAFYHGTASRPRRELLFGRFETMERRSGRWTSPHPWCSGSASTHATVYRESPGPAGPADPPGIARVPGRRSCRAHRLSIPLAPGAHPGPRVESTRWREKRCSGVRCAIRVRRGAQRRPQSEKRHARAPACAWGQASTECNVPNLVAGRCLDRVQVARGTVAAMNG